MVDMTIVVTVAASVASAAIVSKLITQPARVSAEVESRLRNIEITTGIIKSYIDHLKIPPPQQLDFNDRIAERVRVLEVQRDRRAQGLEAGVARILERMDEPRDAESNPGV